MLKQITIPTGLLHFIKHIHAGISKISFIFTPPIFHFIIKIIHMKEVPTLSGFFSVFAAFAHINATGNKTILTRLRALLLNYYQQNRNCLGFISLLHSNRVVLSKEKNKNIQLY
jgi:hypothetical protein